MKPWSRRLALRLGIMFVLFAGLLGPPARAYDHVFHHVERTIDVAHARSSRAVDRAVDEMPAISLERKIALLRCIDHHLACARQDLVAAVEARDRCDDHRLAALVDLEIREYRTTCDRLRELRERIARA